VRLFSQYFFCTRIFGIERRAFAGPANDAVYFAIADETLGNGHNRLM
jgi:hypothetical protein